MVWHAYLALVATEIGILRDLFLDVDVLGSELVLDRLGEWSVSLDKDVVRVTGRLLHEAKGTKGGGLRVEGVPVDGDDGHFFVKWVSCPVT